MLIDMDATVQEQLTRLESALNTLIDSITSYNPSPAAALDLVSADDELRSGLDHLATHQANYTHITKLRETSQTLDDHIKSTLRTLADTRKELLSAPTASQTTPVNPVDFHELLNYARRIAKFTVPPTYRSPIPDHDHAVKAEAEAPDATMAGMGDEPGRSNGTVASSPAEEGATDTATERTSQGMGINALSKEQKDWLDPQTTLAFTPWPNEDVIRSGGLAYVQGLIARGVDPNTVTEPEGHAVGGGERTGVAADDEAIRREAEEQERKRKESAAAGRRMTGLEQAPVFGGLDLYDPEEG